MLRAFFVGIAMCAVASLGAAPAYAHGHGHTPHAAKSAPAPASAKHAATIQLRRLPCDAPRVIARELVHPYHSHAPGHPHHDDTGHDPSDHSHPPGEDFVFHVMLHLGLDFTPLSEMMPALSQAADGGIIARPNSAGLGITVLPPVPPPLS